MDLKPEDYAVLVADIDEETNKRLNGLGNPNKQQARVLFTTQQRVEMQAKRLRSFEAIKDFWFDGKPRAVRCWDEQALPGRPITINAAQVESMKDAAGDYAPDE